MNDRINEVSKHLKDMEVDLPLLQVVMIAADLQTIARGAGCLGVGGCSVRHWIQRWLADNGVLVPGEQMANTHVVSAVLHFWSWDEDQYGPWTEDAKRVESDFQRSPIWRLGDAEPIDRVAARIINTDAK